MATIRGLKLLFLLGIIMFFVSKGSVSYAQNTFPANGNVGIGTGSPGALLEVDGGSFFLRGGNVNLYNDGGGLFIRNSAGVVSIQLRENGGNSYFRNGNVGIGTTSPTAKLEVNGGSFLLRGGNINLFNTGGGLFMRNGSGTVGIQLMESGGNSYFRNGNLGIGTTTPTAKLDVNGGSFHLRGGNVNLFNTGGGLFMRNDAGTVGIQLVESGGNSFFRNGNLGIGTTVPTARLHVAGDVKVDGNLGIGTTSPGAKLEVNGGSFHLRGGNVNLFNTGGGLFMRNDAGVVGIQLVESGGNSFFRNGNVGIGTSAPTAKLHVAGDVKVDGNIAAKYQDVAEWVRAPSPLPAGTLVVIDPTEINQVQLASEAYDTRVAGVISLRPGILLGEAGDDKAKVAHSGRVKVKADAQFGPIKIGDLLVSSTTPGYAMRSMPIEINEFSMHRPGTIIGKALEPLKEGQGEILMLLTLQ